MNVQVAAETSAPASSQLESPFFVVGCGRSGTTLLRSMLTHHPDIAIPVESLFIIDFLRASPQMSIKSLTRLLVHDYEFREWNMPVSAADFAGCQTSKDLIDRMHELYMAGRGKKYWGQKTPRFVRHGALLRSFYPHAKFIHVIRDSRAVAASLIQSNLHRSNALYAARRWNKDVLYGLALKEDYPGDVLEVRYEDLVTSPEQTLRTICTFLGIEFDPSMLDYHQQGTQEYNPIFNQAHRRLNERPEKAPIGAWRDRLSAKEIELIEWVCADTMRRVSYEPETNPQPPSRTLLLRMRIDRAIKLLEQIVHRIVVRPLPLYSFVWRKLRLGIFWKDMAEVNY